MKNKIFAILVTLLLVTVLSISVFACNDNSSTTPPPTQEGGDKLPSPDENEPVEDVVPLQITSTTFEIYGNEMYLKNGVGNNVNSFNFEGHLVYDNRATLTISSVECKVNGKIVTLNEGNNTFTITLSYAERSESWTATIYRTQTHTVTFKVLDTVVATQEVIEDQFAVAPTDVEIPKGYEWNGEWGYSLASYPIFEDTTFQATLKKTDYIIEYRDVSVSNDWAWKFNFDSEDVLLPTPEDIDNATFSHWEDESGNVITKIPTGTFNNVVVFAKWDFWTFNINLNFFGASLYYWDFDRQENVELQNSYTFTTKYSGEEQFVPTPNGQLPGIGVQYSFNGWAIDSYNGEIINAINPDGTLNYLIPKEYLPKENGGSLNLYATYQYNYNDLLFSDYLGGVAYSVDLREFHDFSVREVMAYNTAGTALYVKEKKEAGDEVWDLVIPGTYNGKSVYVLDGAFNGETAPATITSITLKDGIAYLGKNTFRGLSSVEKVTINGNYTIPYASFAKLDSLKELTLNGVTRIEDYAFENVTTIEKFVVSNSINYIAPTALTGLNSATVMNDYTLDDVIYYGNENNNYLILADGGSYQSSSITIPSSTKIILHKAFNYNDNLINLSFANGSALKQIGKESFYNNTLQTAKIPSSVEYVGLHAFNGDRLTVLEKNDSGLYYLDGWVIKSYELDTGSYTFIGAKGAITLNADTKGIMIGALEHLGDVESFTIDASNPNFITTGGVLYNKESNVIVRFPTAMEGSYSLPDTVRKVAPYAMEGAKLSVLFGLSNVEKIGEYAFANNYYRIQDDLSSAQNLKIVEDFAYHQCIRYRRVVLNKSVERVGISVFGNEFNYYNPYRELYNLTNISNDYFYGFADIYNDISVNGKITIDNGTWVMVKEADESGYTLLDYYGQDKEITIPSAYSKIGVGAFAYRNVEKIIFSEELKTIGAHAFSHCESLESVVLKNGLITISDNAFEYCAQLSQIVQSGALSIETIGSYAFYECASLDTFMIQDSVTRIGSYAFPDNTNVAFASTDGWRVANSIYDWNTRTGGMEKDIYEHFSNTTGISDRNRLWFKPL